MRRGFSCFHVTVVNKRSYAKNRLSLNRFLSFRPFRGMLFPIVKRHRRKFLSHLSDQSTNRSFALTKGFFVKYLIPANDYSITKEKWFLSTRDVRKHLFHQRRQRLWNCNGRDVRRSRWQTTLGLTGKYRTTTWRFGEASKTIAPVERIKREQKIGSLAKTAEYNVRV